MGRLTYADDVVIDLEDRALAHLQLAMAAKLRRGEGFHLSWSEGQAGGNGRVTVWVRPEMPLVFLFHDAGRPSINRRWVELLLQSADTAAGLRLVPEPESEAPAGAPG